MRYSVSATRVDFEERIESLLAACRRASKLPTSENVLQTMVYQCAVFQTSAALETYIKLLIESWIQLLKNQNKGSQIPDATAGFIYASKIRRSFHRFIHDNDEGAVNKAVFDVHSHWPVLNKIDEVPSFFDGKIIHDKVAYPSLKNLKRLFNRLGIPGIEDKVGQVLRRDAAVMIENFQSVRTSLAHSAPITVTIVDVKRLLDEMRSLVRALDRIFFKHVMSHGGPTCWR
jgi:hypothetical protein